jgi:membrane-bound metal-dependent hydrolase YbcI (DUF457 family)
MFIACFAVLCKTSIVTVRLERHNQATHSIVFPFIFLLLVLYIYFQLNSSISVLKIYKGNVEFVNLGYVKYL